MKVQIIERDGKPEWAVIPYDDYHRLIEALEDTADTQAIDDFYARLARGEEELLPARLLDRIINGENPIRVWREYRGLTLETLGADCGVTKAFLSQIENGKRSPSIALLKKLAAALAVDVDDLI